MKCIMFKVIKYNKYNNIDSKKNESYYYWIIINISLELIYTIIMEGND